MATVDTMWYDFDTVSKTLVDHFRLDGYIVKENDYCRDRLMLAFHFNKLYLRIRDIVFYDVMDLDKMNVFYDTVNHLKDIEYQFRFYFEGIWG